MEMLVEVEEGVGTWASDTSESVASEGGKFAFSSGVLGSSRCCCCCCCRFGMVGIF